MPITAIMAISNWKHFSKLNINVQERGILFISFPVAFTGLYAYKPYLFILYTKTYIENGIHVLTFRMNGNACMNSSHVFNHMLWVAWPCERGKIKCGGKKRNISSMHRKNWKDRGIICRVIQKWHKCSNPTVFKFKKKNSLNFVGCVCVLSCLSPCLYHMGCLCLKLFLSRETKVEQQCDWRWNLFSDGEAPSSSFSVNARV